jgi:hypothetical protein
LKVHDFSELSARERRAYGAKQSALVGLGVVSACLEAVAHHPANHDGNLADKGIDLLDELLQGGNKAVQAAVIDFVTHHDRDNKFLFHMRSRLTHSAGAIKERHDRTAHGFVLLSPGHRAAYDHAVVTLELLQMLCEVQLCDPLLT